MGRKWKLWLICISFMAGACSHEKETAGRLLDTEKMQAVMWDVFQADAFTTTFQKKDSSKSDIVANAALKKKIFLFHGITKEDFDRSYQYYSARPDEMRVMLDTLTVRAERQRNTLMMDRYSKGSLRN